MHIQSQTCLLRERLQTQECGYTLPNGRMWLHRKQGPEKLKQNTKQAVRWSKDGRTTNEQRKYPGRQDHSKSLTPKNRIRMECFMNSVNGKPLGKSFTSRHSGVGKKKKKDKVRVKPWSLSNRRMSNVWGAVRYFYFSICCNASGEEQVEPSFWDGEPGRVALHAFVCRDI